MKKNTILIIAVIVSILGTSCKKDNNSNNQNNSNSKLVNWEYTLGGVNYSFSNTIDENGPQQGALASFQYDDPGGIIALLSPATSGIGNPRDHAIAIQIGGSDVTGAGNNFIFNPSTYDLNNPNIGDAFGVVRVINGVQENYTSSSSNSNINLNLTRYDANSLEGCGGIWANVGCAGYVDGTFSGTISGYTNTGILLPPKQINGSFHAIRLQ